MRLHKTTLALIAICLASVQMQAADNNSLKILWIGNSYSYYNELPNTVKDIAASQNIKLSITRFLKGGERFAGHVKNPELIKALRRGGWDFVILQGYSSTPAYSTESVVRDIYPLAHTLDSLAKAHSPKCHVVYYMTWGHKNGNLRQTDYPLDDTYDLMQERIKTTYIEMAYMNNGWCAPVGMAWQRVRKEYPKVQLYRDDNYHPSLIGSYLAANVIFTTLFQRHYQTKVTTGLPIEQAIILQLIAQQTVFNNLRLLNIKK